jgi:hypothetical protein
MSEVGIATFKLLNHFSLELQWRKENYENHKKICLFWFDWLPWVDVVVHSNKWKARCKTFRELFQQKMDFLEIVRTFLRTFSGTKLKKHMWQKMWPSKWPLTRE